MIKYFELANFIHKKIKLHRSPEQISKELKKQFPGDKTMNASHETIYTYLYILPMGELRKELIIYCRRKKCGIAEKGLRKNVELSKICLLMNDPRR